MKQKCIDYHKLSEKQTKDTNSVKTITNQAKNKASKNIETITKLTPDKIN